MLNLEEENKKIEQAVGQGADPFDVASLMHGLYSVKFEQMVASLSTGNLRRLANALVLYPLSDKMFIGEESEALKNAFAVGSSLLEAKWLMIQKTLMDVEEVSSKNSNIEEAVIVTEGDSNNEKK